MSCFKRRLVCREDLVNTVMESEVVERRKEMFFELRNLVTWLNLLIELGVMVVVFIILTFLILTHII